VSSIRVPLGDGRHLVLPLPLYLSVILLSSRSHEFILLPSEMGPALPFRTDRAAAERDARFVDARGAAYTVSTADELLRTLVIVTEQTEAACVAIDIELPGEPPGRLVPVGTLLTALRGTRA
jgi:hypothetical protein